MQFAIGLGRKTFLSMAGAAALAAAFSAPASAASLSISGAPKSTVNVGEYFRWTPTVTRANDHKLTFTIENRPNWVWFHTGRGLMIGAPSRRDIGNYANVVITVTDGTTTKKLRPFAIAVTQKYSTSTPKPKPDPKPTPPPETDPTPTPTTGTATLTWMPPLENTDGSTLTNLAGYRIVYGTATNALTKAIQIPTAGLASYTIENLAVGTWYFAVRAYTSQGVESDNSAVVSRRIQ